ncbi:MAG: efflux RND transporter permease subunit [Thermodesulfobacteriota bacterium]|nr:efflux RND transporter permease subunit [Thermodesulfobacteriota bacterium]
MSDTEKNKHPGDVQEMGMISKIVEKFLNARLALMLVAISLCLGAASLMVTPREEEPQIVVPMADVFVSAPGASPEEIEKLVACPLENLLWQIDGVEYVYSTSSENTAMVTVRFYVGEDREKSLVKLYNKISMNADDVSPIIQNWVVKPVEIDDVSIVNITLFSDQYSDHELYRTGQEVLSRLSQVKNISRTAIYGGRPMEIRINLLPGKMDGFNVSMAEVEQVLKGADASVTAGTYPRNDQEFSVTTSSFLKSVSDISALVVGTSGQRPVYLRDIAEIKDGPAQADTYTHFQYSKAWAEKTPGLDPDRKFAAVTLAVSKKRGTNAVDVARKVILEFNRLEQDIVPNGMYAEVTRNYGQTAQEKVSGLIESLGFAIFSVVVLLAFTLGWREALIVAVAVPVSFSLALFVNYLFGYTINRVTLFALILSLGLVVDDPITNVENIQRHIKKGLLDPFNATLTAVNEVLPPVLMSTLAIIICFTPLFFITGMMGPYMAPMAVNVPLTVIFSTLCALTIVPWLSHFLLKTSPVKAAAESADDMETSPSGRKKEPLLHRVYRGIVTPFLTSKFKRFLMFAAIVILLVISCSLALFRLVPLKLLPFDNKNEFQIVIDMIEGTSLERTAAVVTEFETFLRDVPEVVNMISYTGDASPMDFNGMVRHYFLRKAGNLADIRVNLLPKKERKQQSHAILLRIRTQLEKIAQKHQARIKLVEVPPGPPVLSTIVGEIYGTSDMAYSELIHASDTLEQLMAQEPFVVDIDTMAESPHKQTRFFIDREKAAIHGITTRTITRALYGALTGLIPATLHTDNERQALKIRLTTTDTIRSSMVDLTSIPVKEKSGRMIPLSELVTIKKTNASQPIFHKNLERVVYVLADTAGRAPAEAVIDMQGKLKHAPLPSGAEVNWSGEGEWKITIRVFRDMGIAFAAAMVGIYILLVLQSGSFLMPVLIMLAIPLTLLGIMPGFLLLNLITSPPVGEFANPVFFTATSMIGMIALGGIVIRNALVLIEFIQEAVSQGNPFKEAILQSGAIRIRPILLTALTTAIGAFPITFDPVFSGLAWALIFGLMASTLFTLIVIPVAYYGAYNKQYALRV